MSQSRPVASDDEAGAFHAADNHRVLARSWPQRFGARIFSLLAQSGGVMDELEMFAASRLPLCRCGGLNTKIILH